MTKIPVIPETAPFDAMQRMWLNGFLAGLFSSETGTAIRPGGRRIALTRPALVSVWFADREFRGSRKAVRKGGKEAGLRNARRGDGESRDNRSHQGKAGCHRHEHTTATAKCRTTRSRSGII